MWLYAIKIRIRHPAERELRAHTQEAESPNGARVSAAQSQAKMIKVHLSLSTFTEKLHLGFLAVMRA